MTLDELQRRYTEALCDDTTTDEELNDLWWAIHDMKEA